MALGRREGERQEALWVPSETLRSPGHPFYDQLNSLLAHIDFDRRVEALFAPYYRECGRPGIPAGVYYRMLFVGYFERLASQRAIAWRCADSLSLRSFLGLRNDERVPDHSSLTRIRQRIPMEVDQAVHEMVLGLAATQDLLDGKTLGMDATLMAANAAMRNIVRRDSGKDWKEYVGQLAREEGVAIESDEDLRRFDKTRKKKRTSNRDWESPTDPDARITRLKDGTTRLGYKVQHAVDMESGIVVDADAHPGDKPDSEAMEEGVRSAQEHLDGGETEAEVEEVVADKGYHKTSVLAGLESDGIRTYIPERRERRQRRWTDKPEGWKEAVYGNRRRVRGERGRRLQRGRGEKVERSFAHAVDGGGRRRLTLRGLQNVKRWVLMTAVAMNLGTILRDALGVGTPKMLADLAAALHSLEICAREALNGAASGLWCLVGRFCQPIRPETHSRHLAAHALPAMGRAA